MKTLIIVLFSIVSCYGQSFMMKMNVVEVIEDTTRYTDSVKVVWAVGQWEEVAFIWNDKKLYFDKQQKDPTRRQRRRIKEIRDKYDISKLRRKYDVKVKHESLYLNRWNEVFLITIYVDKGILIWINRVDGRYPCYFFKMTI